MKILFITDNFPPEVNAPATRTYEHCREWVKAGVDVTILTCAPNFPQGKLFDGYKNKIYQTEYMDGIKVIRVWSYIASNSGFFKRISDYFSFAFMAFIVGLFQKFDIIVATSPQFYTTWAAYGVSKIKSKPWVFELRDLWPESIDSLGVLTNKRVIAFLETVELGLYRDAAKVIAVTTAFKKNLIARGIDEDHIEVVTNGVNSDIFQPAPKDEELLKTLNLQGKFIIGYLGTHGLAHGLDFIVKSIRKIKDQDIHFIFIGDGSRKEEIIKFAKELKVNNITFLNMVSKKELHKYLTMLDVSLVPLKKLDVFKTVIPSKIFESASMQIPILLGVEGEAERIIKAYGAGICFDPENEKDFIEKVLTLKNDKVLYRDCQVGGERLAHAFDRKKLANKMLKILEEV